MRCYRGAKINLAIMEALKESCCLIIKDDSETYKSRHYKTQYGKPLIIDQTDYDTLQIFFDDQIKEDE